MLELHAAGVLAALAAAVFAAQCSSRPAVFALMVAGFAGGALAFARLGPLDASALGFCIAGAAVSGLARPSWWVIPPLAAGVSAAGWTSILEAQGLPWLPGTLAAGGLLAAAAGLAARRRGFMPPALRDEALVIVASFALLLAIGPDIVAGWRSSVVLKAEPLAAAGPQIGPWLAALVVVSLLLGGAYTLWKRR